MNYSVPHNAFILNPEKLQHAAACMRYAIKAHRKAHGLPLIAFKYPPKVDDVYMVEQSILDAAKALGILFEKQRAGELDVSDAG